MDVVTFLMGISSTIILLFPLIFSLVVRKKAFGKLYASLLGIAGYLVANFGLNKLINFITGNAIEKMFDTNPMLASTLDGFQQGFVEEIMRFLLMLFLMKKCLQKENSLMYAAGHGGIEMIIRGAGLAAGVVTAVVHPEDSPYIGMPIFSPFLFPILFAFVFCLHIGLSYLVFRAVKDRKYLLVVLAVILHAFANLSTGLEVPLIPIIGPFVVIIGLMIYTIIGYKRDRETEWY